MQPGGGKSTLFMSLDLRIVFDTIKHPVLLQQLSHSFGVAGTALSWIKCYRKQSVSIGQYLPLVVPCSIGVSQGSVLSPLLFAVYTSSIAVVVQSHDVQQ